MLFKTYMGILLLLSYVNVVTAQLDFPIPLPQYVEATPIWSFMPEWQDQVGIPMDSGEYKKIWFTFLKENDDYIFVGTDNNSKEVLEDSITISHKRDGIGIFCLDKKTGEQKWKNIYNRSNGAADWLHINYKNVLLDKSKLHLVGNRSIQAKYSNKYSFSYSRTYDANNGELISYNYDKNDSIILAKKPYLNGLYLRQPDKKSYLHFLSGAYGFNEYLRYDNYFQKIYEPMDSASLTLDTTITYEPSIPLSPISYHGGSQFIQQNDSLLLVLIPTRSDPDVANSTVELIWINFADVNNIFISRKKRIEDIAFFNEWDYRKMILKIYNNEIFITDFYYDYEKNESSTYFIHMDPIGNVITHTPRIEIGDHNYGLITNILYHDGDKTYIEGWNSITGLCGGDILSIAKDGSVKLETTITTGHTFMESNRSDYIFNKGLISDEGTLILGRTIIQEVPGVEWYVNATNHLVAWDVRDLGMEWKPNNTVAIKALETLQVFPNPTKGLVKINLPHSINNISHIGIYNIKGQQLKTVPYNNNLPEIDLTPFSNGIYYIHLFDTKGTLLSKEKVIKI